ncbi:uncharacterized protein LOC126983562 [Eriocheir sinensis]|uniref:uncharacterized protein LOC126983562 n=1 Tax=Eriocheir sinensis TaxID=95602 RepID=UPI0021C65A9B|nr:uncharacterized protein LOC126983562 [Eriocheir sinensis]
MAGLLLPLLLLCWGHTATASPQAWWCAAHYHTLPTTQAPQDPAAPCYTNEDAVTLALPILLSLKNHCQVKSRRCGWGMNLHLLDGTGLEQGVVKVRWSEKLGGVVMLGIVTCCNSSNLNTYRVTLQPDPVVHLQVEAAGPQVTLSLLKATGKATVMTLTFQDGLPSKVTASPYTRWGYPAANTTTTTAANTTTTPTTSHPLVLVITVLVAISVVVSVAMLVLVWCGWPGGVPAGATR